MSHTDAGSRSKTTPPFPEPVLKSDLVELAKRHLADHLDKPGGILYSSHETIQAGDMYLIGFNPGGRGGTPLRESIDDMLKRETNAYCDEAWERNGKPLEMGTAPLQQRVRWLLKQFDKDSTKVCASNLIFMQSTQAGGVDYCLAEECWPVHKAILGIVQPKVIIAFGNSDQSAFKVLRDKLENGTKPYEAPSGHGHWKLKSFSARLHGRDVLVLGIPHLSRYSPEQKKEFNVWLEHRKKELAEG